MIAKCKCTHDFQDAQHGRGYRVHNKSKDGMNMYCTICDDRKATSAGRKFASAKKGKKK